MARHQVVLLVAPYGLIRNVRAAGLEIYGYEVQVANNGAQAQEMLRSNRAISVVIIDADLGGEINGLAAARFARDTIPRIDVIYTSRMPNRITHTDMVSGAPILRDPYHSHQLAAVLSHLRQRSPESGMTSAA
jgi:CheY-like chemotaxis protein